MPSTIVVGAGSAGAVLARRLTEDGAHSVLLLEAGPDYPDPRALPRDLVDGRRNSMTAHDWGYRHRPNSRQLMLPLPRGRVVGGSSAVNTCIALRGQPEDYDEWGALGLREWSWQACLPAFKRLEHDLDVRAPFHGDGGPLPIRRHPEREWVTWQAAFVQACRALGFPDCPDGNAPGARGVGAHAMNKLDGRRISVAEAYLTPEVRARAGLALRSRTLVRRVLVRNGRAIGVEVESPRGLEVLHSERVVLCAGALNTPALLLRSGIGPAADVARLGCELVRDLPGVGLRLLDHPGFAIFLRPRLFGKTSRHDPVIQTMLRYPSGTSHPSDMMVQPGSKVTLPRFDAPLMSVMAQIGKPRGSGVLRILSAKPRAKPVIESRLLDDERDRALGVLAIELAYELVQQPSMREHAAHFWPGQRVLRRKDRIDAWIRRACDSGYHPCGSVPMGLASDPHAGTDERGRVRGVEALYVADASLFPTIPSSNIHLAVLMVAERMAEWLR